MMHILLVILKILGWILLTILGLVVLLVFIALFMPVRYKLSGECEGSFDSLKGIIRFSWLLHLVKGNIIYRDGKLDWSVRIAWKKIKADAEELPETSYPEELPKQIKAPDDAPIPKTEDIRVKEGALSSENPEKNSTNDMPDSLKNTRIEDSIDQKHKSFFNKLKELYLKIVTAIKNFLLRIKKLYSKIKYTIYKIYATIKSLLTKTEKVLEFLQDEIHQSAFKAVIIEFKKLFRFLKPKKMIISARFGFEDPSTTGHILAIISMIYPFLGKHTNIQPDFDDQTLEGSILISGNIRFVYIFSSLCNLLRNRNFRLTFKHIKNFKL
jgi:hypothetical protein